MFHITGFTFVYWRHKYITTKLIILQTCLLINTRTIFECTRLMFHESKYSPVTFSADLYQAYLTPFQCLV